MPTISVSGSTNNNAGSIDIALRENLDSTLQITGTHNILNLTNQETLDLLAVGGKGIDGLVGADGRHGTSGRDGFDATEFCDGINGTPGGDGEHGQAGTHGGDSGNGGSIKVTAHHTDLALIDIINEMNVSAGIPGHAGKHGRGGKGGPGGRGGSMCIGIHTTSLSSSSYYHAGGSDGPDGRDGGSYSYPLYPGKVGIDGNINFHILQDDNTTFTHNAPYQLKAQNISFHSLEQNGVWEPGDLITAVYSVHNYAISMPSPLETIPLHLRMDANFRLDQHGEVWGNIAAGQWHESTSLPVKFFLTEPVCHKNSRPYKKTVPVIIDPHNVRLNRPFKNSSTSNWLTIQYPVQLEMQNTNFFSIAENETQLLQATIKNIATKSLGQAAGREVEIEITSVEDKVTLVSENIELLESQHSHQITYELPFKIGATFGEHLHFRANLFLQPLSRTDTKTLIQRQNLTVQLTSKYQPTQNGFLLVINAKTNQEEIQYWQNLIQKLTGNADLTIWNTSYYGHLNLDGNPSLLKDTAHGTIIILDNSFILNSQKQHNSKFITKKDILKASNTHDVSLLIVGDKSVCAPYSHVDELRENNKKCIFVATNEPEKDIIKHLLNNDSNILYQASIPFQQNGFCGKRLSAQDRLEILRNNLAKIFPYKNFHVTMDWAHAFNDYVTLNVHQLSDVLLQDIKQIHLTSKESAHPINHDALIQKGLINALPFSQKFQLFIQTGNQYHHELAKALTKDLLNEQNLVLRTEHFGSLLERILRKNQHNFISALKNLHQLVNLLESFSKNGDFHNVEIWSPLIIQIIAKVQYHAEQHSSFWQRFINWFIPQPSEQVIKTSALLCNQVLQVQSACSNISMDKINNDVHHEKQILKLVDELQMFINKYDNNNASNYCCVFFGKPVASKAELAAAKQLLLICQRDSENTKIDDYYEILTSSTKLKNIFSKFEKLFPELQMPRQEPQKILTEDIHNPYYLITQMH